MGMGKHCAKTMREHQECSRMIIAVRKDGNGWNNDRHCKEPKHTTKSHAIADIHGGHPSQTNLEVAVGWRPPSAEAKYSENNTSTDDIGMGLSTDFVLVCFKCSCRHMP